MVNKEKSDLIQELKKLRATRQDQIKRVQDMVRSQKKIISTLTECLQEGPRTVPELASMLEMPTSQILWYVAALKKYGQILEGEKKGDYFSYTLATRDIEQ